MIFKNRVPVPLYIIFIIFSFITLSCVEKPFDPDFDQHATQKNNPIQKFNQIIVDTGGVYWGLNESALQQLSISADNRVIVKKSRTLYNTFYSYLIQNSTGLPIFVSNDLIMNITKLDDSIIFSNSTYVNVISNITESLYFGKYCIDSSNDFWFVGDENPLVLYRWDGHGIVDYPLGTYFYGTVSAMTANKSKVIILLKDYDSQNDMIITIDKRGVTWSKIWKSGLFSIKKIFFLDSTLHAVMSAITDEPIRFKNHLIDTLISIKDHLVLASIIDSNFTIRYIFDNSKSMPRHILPSSQELLWVIDGYAITKISADSIAQINGKIEISGCFFLNKNALFSYNPFSGKIVRLDNLLGFKSYKIDQYLNW